MQEDAMREMIIDSIRVSIVNYQQRVVILRVKESNRYLPIWIGPTEADAIAFKLQNVAAPRPLTHDLLETVISTLGAEIKRILVSDLNNDTFYAKIILEVNGADVEVDSRPSDAIALAVRTNAPIFAHNDVIEKAGVEMDEEGRPVQAEIGEDAAEPVKEEELKSLSAFTDFIETLNLDDLGKGEIPPSSEASSPEGTT
jgi:bifunctional DNase/RNase